MQKRFIITFRDKLVTVILKIEFLKKSKFQFSNFKFYNLGLGSFFAVGAVLEFEYMKRKKEVN